MVFGETEEVVFLIAPFRFLIGVKRAKFLVNQVSLFFELFAADAVEALLLAQVDVAIGFDPLVELIDDRLVPWSGGSAKAVVLDVELLPEIFEAADDLVTVLLGRSLMLFCGALDLLTMFISARDHQRWAPLQSLVSAQGIQRHSGVSTTDMGDIIDVVQRRCRREASVFVVSVCHTGLNNKPKSGYTSQTVLLKSRRYGSSPGLGFALHYEERSLAIKPTAGELTEV